MNKTLLIGLTGHADQFRLDEAAYDRLARYLERAEIRLRDDPDRAEVVGDLERSIGDRLATMPSDTVVSALEMDAILERVGAVDTGRDTGLHPASDEERQRPRRRLVRIREGQVIAGGPNLRRPGHAVHGRDPWPGLCGTRAHPAGRAAERGAALIS